MTRPRVYCSVYGCMNSTTSKPELSFFKLPADAERRHAWLRRICREDLLNKPPKSYTVCEEHFETADVLPGTQRKKLKTTSLPSLHLPNIEGESAQVSEASSSNTPRKRKRISKLECEKKLKTHNTGHETENVHHDDFHKLCDKLLTKELAELVKAQIHIKFNCTGNRYQDYEMFCLKLYYTSPQAYRLLQKAICLPCPKTLIKHEIPATTEINDRLLSILKTKVEAMTDMERNCSVVIDAMNLKANLFYNIKQDKIIGFQEIDGVQSTEPAKHALVVMVCGIFINWKQPVGFALLSESKISDETARWLDKLLERLFEIGLNIRTFVSDMGSDLIRAAKKRSVTIERPYFFINNRIIYYIFDPHHLIKLIRNNLISFDFHFQNRVAKYEHIVQFYENDKQKSFKFAHKLTNSHIHPTNFERMKLCYATQLLSNSVANGISTYVDFNVIPVSGKGTAEFIRLMKNLFDALSSSNLKANSEYRRAFCGKESQKSFFNEMIIFFRNLKLIHPENGKDVTSNVKFIQGFQITIKSILLLFEDLKLEGCTYLVTRSLNLDVLQIFFGHIRKKNSLKTGTTSRQFISAFQKLLLLDIMKPPKAGNHSDDLEKFLIHINALYQLNDEVALKKEIEIENPKMNEEQPDSSVQIISSEYNQLNLPEKNSLFYVCGFLLKKCAERHNDCPILKSYIKPDQTTNKYKDHSKHEDRNLQVSLPQDFVKYVKKIDEIFRRCFQKDLINCKISAFIYKEIDKVKFLLPCPCFPIIYLKKLFIRMRIFYTLKFNNNTFRTSRRKR